MAERLANSGCRSDWVGTSRDCTISSISDVFYDLCVTVWNTELPGDGFNDISKTKRGYFKRRVLQTLLKISQMESLGTIDTSVYPPVYSFMYKNKIPKVEGAYEVLRTSTGIKCGFRFHFIVHDPAFLFGNGVLKLAAMNASDNSKDRAKRKSTIMSTPKEHCPYEEWKELECVRTWGVWLKGMFMEESESLDTYNICDTSKHLTSFGNPGNPHMVLSLQRDLEVGRIPKDISPLNRPRDDQMDVLMYRQSDDRRGDVLGALNFNVRLPGYCDGITSPDEVGMVKPKSISDIMNSGGSSATPARSNNGGGRRMGVLRDVLQAGTSDKQPRQDAGVESHTQQESWTLTFPCW
jgi:hypothetical protein